MPPIAIAVCYRSGKLFFFSFGKQSQSAVDPEAIGTCPLTKREIKLNRQIDLSLFSSPRSRWENFRHIRITGPVTVHTDCAT